MSPIRLYLVRITIISLRFKLFLNEYRVKEFVVQNSIFRVKTLQYNNIRIFPQIKIFALEIRKLNGQDEMNDYENN